MAGYPAHRRDLLRGPQLPDPASDVMGAPGSPGDVMRGPQAPRLDSDVIGGAGTRRGMQQAGDRRGRV